MPPPTPKELVATLPDITFDVEGERYRVVLKPGLSDGELRGFESRLGCPLPPDIAALLRYTRGFEFAAFEHVAFTRITEFPGFPLAVQVAQDGWGNDWIIDIDPITGAWGSVFYAGHDPTAFVFQATDLVEFLRMAIAYERDPENVLDPIVQMHVSYPDRIYHEHPGLIPLVTARASPDATLRAFAERLTDPQLQIADLRPRALGSGFSPKGGRGGRVVRHGAELLFAFEPGGPPAFERAVIRVLQGVDRLLSKRRRRMM